MSKDTARISWGAALLSASSIDMDFDCPTNVEVLGFSRSERRLVWSRSRP